MNDLSTSERKGDVAAPTPDPDFESTLFANSGGAEAAPLRSPVRFADLLVGLPALFLAVLLLATLAWVSARRPIADEYEKEALKRFGERDYPSALVCAKRLVALHPDKPEMRYFLVLIHEQLGQTARAEGLARAMAPVNQVGFAPAHLWMARHMLLDRGRPPGEARDAERHLLRHLQVFPKSEEALTLLGNLYAMNNRPSEARPLLEGVAPGHPDRLLTLANVCGGLGDAEECRRHATAAKEIAQKRTEEHPDDHQSRLYWASALANLGEFPKALDLLAKGATLGEEEIYKQGMAAVCSGWAESLAQGDKVNSAERMAVIEKGLRYDPSNAGLLVQLAAVMSTGGAEAEKARASFRAMLAAGKATEIAHLALGNDAWNQDKTDEARAHWEQALAGDKQLPLVANNLAWLLAYKEPTDLPRALSLIDQALTQVPRDPRLRGTRGQVLAKLERWKEAVTDLEFALAGGESSKSIHEAIATAYEHVGLKDMAAEHRKAIQGMQ